MKQMGGNALKAEKQGWEWVGGGNISFSLKNISSYYIIILILRYCIHNPVPFGVCGRICKLILSVLN